MRFKVEYLKECETNSFEAKDSEIIIATLIITVVRLFRNYEVRELKRSMLFHWNAWVQLNIFSLCKLQNCECYVTTVLRAHEYFLLFSVNIAFTTSHNMKNKTIYRNFCTARFNFYKIIKLVLNFCCLVVKFHLTVIYIERLDTTFRFVLLNV